MSFIFAWLVEGAAIAGAAALALRLIPASCAAQRHVCWSLAMLGVLLVPWVPEVFTGAAPINLANAVSVTTPAAAWPFHVPAVFVWVGPAAVSFWALVSLLSVARLVANLRAVLALANSASPLTAVQEAALTQFIAARATSRAARVCVSSAVHGACAVGFLRPRILLSSELVTALDVRSLEAIVLHEYAHLQRFDDWTRLIQRAVLAVAGMHPAVRWISRQIDIEREVACDQLVVQRTGAPEAYARSLTTAAALTARVAGLTPIALPGASLTRAGLHARVVRLLDGGVASRRRAWGSTLATSTALATAVSMAAGMPPIVFVAVIEPPMPVLAQLPLRADMVRELSQGPPAVTGKVAAAHVAVQPGPSGAAPRATIADTRSVTNVPTATVPDHEPVPASRLQVNSVVGDPVVPPTQVQPPIDALALPQVSVALREQAVTAARPVARSAASVAVTAQRAGLASAGAASRAGGSIGRFFKTGGQAVTNRF